MASTSAAAYGSASTAATAASTLSYSTNHIDWGSKGWTFLFIVSNYGLELNGFDLVFNAGYASHIILTVSDPSANLFELSSLCGLTF